LVFHGPVRVLFLSHPVDTPSTKYRVLQLLPLFKRDGIDVERADIPSGIAGRWALFRRARDFDAVVHQKRLIPGWQFRALRRRARVLVYDFDDPMVYSREEGRVELSATREARFREALRVADAVVVNHAGTEALARQYGASNVHVVPTSVDLSRWRMKDSWKAERLTLGWVGTPANLPNLREIAPALAGRRLKLVTDEPIELPGVEVEFVKWDFESEPGHVRSFDAALAPLPDDPWSRAKMPFKILYYFAAGLPVVASRRGAVETVIRDGENGLLAGDWRGKIELLGDEGLRERLGRAGRRTVEEGYTVEAAYARLKALLVSLGSRT
jgi:glycosyltransferase involved in cell wall biosynthesis